MNEEQEQLEININWDTTVTLTEEGAKVLSDFDGKRHKEGEIYHTELWYLMYIFAPHFHMGGQTFKRNKLIIKNEGTYKEVDTQCGDSIKEV